MDRTRDYRKGFALIGLLLMLAILFILYYLVLKPYLKTTFADKDVQKTLSEDGLATSSPVKIIDSVKKTLKKTAEQRSEY